MKKILLSLLLVCVGFVFTGCELFDTTVDDNKNYEFVNKSTYNVTIIPTAQDGWDGFSIAPGETRKLNDIEDLYFVFEPRFRVEIGENKDGRIVFINSNENNVSGDTGN